MVLKFSDPRLMHRTVPSGVDISAEYMFDYRSQDDSPITRFMHGKCVLITGATGFLGSLFLEKCLRIGVSRVYVLCRPKGGQTAQQRIEELLDEPIFVKITAQDPDFPARIHVLSGDLAQPHLGLSNAHIIELCHRVQFVVHAAADQRLSRTLWRLVRTNVYGTKQLLRLCRRMEQLELFVHVSGVHTQVTADRRASHVEERFYDVHVEPNIVMDVCEVVHRNQLQVLSDRMCWPWPDAVTFTRALAEDVVHRNSDRVPTTVVRPSMLIATSVDPIPGWCPNPYGLNGLMTAVAFGLVRIQRIACSRNVDVICADFVVNSMLAIMWDVCKAKSSVYEIPRPKIYNLTSGTLNPIDAGLFLNHLRHVGHDLATWRTIWWPFTYTLLADWEFKWLHVPLTLCPAWLLDRYVSQRQAAALTDPHISSRPPSGDAVQQLFRRLEAYLNQTRRFLRVQPTFEMNNVLAVYDRMTDFDRETRFPCDVRLLNWKQYLFEYALGARLYMMREPFETVKTAVRRRRTLRSFGVVGAIALTVWVYGARLML